MHEYDLRPQLDVDTDTVSNFDQRPLGRWDTWSKFVSEPNS